MIKMIKSMAMDQCKAVMQSETVSKILASEQVGSVIEKAMTVPFKISEAVATKKEKLVEMFDLATKADMDELRRSMSQMEETLQTLQNNCGNNENK